MSSGGLMMPRAEIVGPDPVDERAGRSTDCPSTASSPSGARGDPRAESIATASPPSTLGVSDPAGACLHCFCLVPAAGTPCPRRAMKTSCQGIDLARLEPGRRAAAGSGRRSSLSTPSSFIISWTRGWASRLSRSAIAVEERGELLEVVLGPLVERVLVALGAFEPDAEEGVAEVRAPSPRACGRSAWPRSRASSRASEKSAGVLVAVVGALLLAVLVVALARLAAGGQDDPLDELVVGHVLLDPAVDPLVPVAGDLLGRAAGC